MRYFHQQFHGATLKGALNPKELAQAARLIEQHGFENAMALVDYAKSEADKTGYAPANLSGIAQYESRFAAERDELETAKQKSRARQEAQQRAQVAQQAQNQSLVADLVNRVGQVKQSAPAAFTAFLRHIEIERDRFLQTPIARQAKPETQLLLSREYQRAAKRLELFIDFFQMGSVGEALLSLSCRRSGSHRLAAISRRSRAVFAEPIRFGSGRRCALARLTLPTHKCGGFSFH